MFVHDWTRAGVGVWCMICAKVLAGVPCCAWYVGPMAYNVHSAFYVPVRCINLLSICSLFETQCR